jgi:hypothetical protein
MSGVTRVRSCAELGVCQNRDPRCTGCREFPVQFAPGVIDGPYRRKRVGAPGMLMRKLGFAAQGVVRYLMGPTP